MATAEQYANWIVRNKDKKGTPEFETVVKAYKLSKGSQPVQQQAAPQPSLPAGNGFIGALETAGTMVSGALAEPIAGLAGMVQAVNPFAGQGAGVEAVQATREALTFQPRTQAGQQTLQATGEVLRPVGEAIKGAESILGDTVFKATGSPALASAATTIPTVALEVLGAAGVKGIGGIDESVKRAAISKGMAEAAPSVEQLKNVSRAAFKEIDDLGAAVDNVQYQSFAKNLSKEVSRLGLDKDVTPSAYKALQRIKQASVDEVGDPKNVNLSELETLRSVAQGAASSLNAQEKMIGVKIIDAIDDFITELPDSAIKPKSGMAPADIGARYKVARDLWGRARRSELLTEALAKADNQASGIENGIRVQFRSILNNKKQKKFFNKEEQAAMREVVQGTKATNLFKLLGKFGYSEGQATNMLMAFLGGVGGAAAFGPLGATIPIAGQISKGLAQRLTKNNAIFADQVVRAGKNGRRITEAYFKNTPKAARSAEELSELLMRPDVEFKQLPDNVIAIEAAKIARKKRERMAQGAGVVTAGASSSAAANEE